MRRCYRMPLLHFLAIGAGLFALDAGLRDDAEGARDPIAVEISDDELLYREARALGFQRSDPIVRRRLVRNMRFVAGVADRSDAELFEEALALGMDRTDLVVRRRLVQKLKLAVQAAARRLEPSEAELADYLARHRERFAQPERVHLSHIFLSRDRRGASLEADARALLDALVASGRDPDPADRLGDPLPLPSEGSLLSQRELAKSFGPEFADAVASLESGAWAGPVRSSYGLHLVWVHGRVPSRPARLSSVRSAVREALLGERAEAELRETLEWLRSRR